MLVTVPSAIAFGAGMYAPLVPGFAGVCAQLITNCAASRTVE